MSICYHHNHYPIMLICLDSDVCVCDLFDIETLYSLWSSFNIIVTADLSAIIRVTACAMTYRYTIY